MLGGGLKGGKIMGKYPEHLSEKSDYWIKRGRMVSSSKTLFISYRCLKNSFSILTLFIIFS